MEGALVLLRQSVDAMLSEQGLRGESLEILEAYRLFAYDRGWKERLRAAVFSGLVAEAAVERVQHHAHALPLEVGADGVVRADALACAVAHATVAREHNVMAAD